MLIAEMRRNRTGTGIGGYEGTGVFGSSPRFGPEGTVLRMAMRPIGPENRPSRRAKNRARGSRSDCDLRWTGPDRTGIDSHEELDQTGLARTGGIHENRKSHEDRSKQAPKNRPGPADGPVAEKASVEYVKREWLGPPCSVLRACQEPKVSVLGMMRLGPDRTGTGPPSGTGRTGTGGTGISTRTVGTRTGSGPEP